MRKHNIHIMFCDAPIFVGEYQMTTNKSRIELILLPPILWFIGMLIEKIFSLINDNQFQTFGSLFGYKTLLLIILLLLSVIISLLIFLSRSKLEIKTSPEIHANIQQLSDQPSDSDLRKLRDRLLSNLSLDEKKFLRLYIDGDTKNVRSDFTASGTANTLVSQGILYLPQQVSIQGSVSYSIHVWAWEMLKNNPKYLK